MNKRCCNCAFRGNVFPLGKSNHAYCEHPQYDENYYEKEGTDPRDNLKQVLETCEDWQPKHLNS